MPRPRSLGATFLIWQVDLAMPKLILMAAVIDAVGARGVQYVRTMGNCEGVAVAERLWRE